MGFSSQTSSRMNVCELFAGIAVMSAVLQSIGWNVSMLYESNVALSAFLKRRFPSADVQLNVEDKPWIQWTKDPWTFNFGSRGWSTLPTVQPNRSNADARESEGSHGSACM